MTKKRYIRPGRLHTQSVATDKSVWEELIDFKFGEFRFKGSLRSGFIVCAYGAVVGTVVYGGYRLIKKYFDCKMLEANTESDIQKIIARRIPLNAKPADSAIDAESTTDNIESNETEVRNWLENFEVEFPQKLFELPPIIADYVSECPVGFEVPVIASLTAELAGCFSNVHAKYLDGKFHRPNIMVVIEAPFSSMKGKIKLMIDTLFNRRIKRDLEKISRNTVQGKIIQTLAPNVTEASLLDILANNRGIHSILMDPETITVANAVKNKNNGITYDVIRKAYDNDEHSRINSRKNAPQGSFTVAINLVLTGTPDATWKFLEAEIEGGTASRMCLCVLPKVGKDIPSFHMPEGEYLSQLQDQLDEWTEKYAYTIDDEGNDYPTQEHEVDMNYVNTALQEWLNNQYDLSQKENNPARANLRMRIASSAFNCAIVWHMLYEEPSSRKTHARKNVIDLTIYTANYFMERWLHKFGSKYNAQQAKFTAEELVNTSSRTSNLNRNCVKCSEIPTDPLEKGAFFLRLKEGGKTITELSQKYNLSRNQINSSIYRFKKHQQKEQI